MSEVKIYLINPMYVAKAKGDPGKFDYLMSRMVMERDFDAQLLRADTAEAELRTERLRADAAVGDANEAERSLAAAEQRIAELEARSNLTNDDLIAIARNAALNSVDRYNYMPCLEEDAYKWRPHYWVIEAMRAALNHNPEAESHE